MRTHKVRGGISRARSHPCMGEFERNAERGRQSPLLSHSSATPWYVRIRTNFVFRLDWQDRLFAENVGHCHLIGLRHG